MNPYEAAQPPDDARRADASTDASPDEEAVTGKPETTDGKQADHELELDYDDSSEVERSAFDDDEGYWADS